MKNITVAALEATLIALLKATTIRDHADLIPVFNRLSKEEMEFIYHLQNVWGPGEFGIWLGKVIEQSGKAEELVTATTSGFEAKRAEVERELELSAKKLKKMQSISKKLDELQAELASAKQDANIEYYERQDQELERIMNEMPPPSGLKN